MSTATEYVFPIQVRFADTDLQGHVYFANYLTYCDEALGGYMRHLGLPWQDMVADGVDIFYRAASCEFLGGATFEMCVEIEPRFVRVGNTSVTCAFELRDPERRDIAKAELTFVCIDTETRQSVAVPSRLRELIERASRPA